jgi:hypothetical protein
MQIEQAVYGSQDTGGYRFLARSPGFLDAWLPLAERLCTGFGERPAGVACPRCVFARPFGPRHVAVVQVADQGADDAGRPGALAFRLLVVPKRLYEDLGGDPFRVADQYPPPWSARGELPALEWTAGLVAWRTVEEITKVLNVPYSPTLLGGVQALLDGGRIVFERNEPDEGLLRSLWALLPDSSRAGLWPASYAFSNAHGFDALVVPRANGPEYDHYVTEAQAGDYPEGRYELNLQIAVEAGDQSGMDALFARRSRAQTVRLVLAILAILVVGALLLLPRAPEPDDRPREKKTRKTDKRGGRAAPTEKLELGDFPRFTEAEQTRLAERLRELGKRLDVAVPTGGLANELAALDAGIDRRLGAKKPRRDPGLLRDRGGPERQLRALLWKHGVAEYNQTGLNPVELVDQLEKKLAEAGILKEPAGQ